MQFAAGCVSLRAKNIHSTDACATPACQCAQLSHLHFLAEGTLVGSIDIG